MKPMDLKDFNIGMEFRDPHTGRVFRTTDVGSRTVIAIRIDEIEIASTSDFGKNVSTRIVPGAEADAKGYFSGPPYGAAELVFDEGELEDLEPVDPPVKLRTAS
jgi:hypothetical protein